MTAVKYEELSVAFDFVSFGAPMEHRAYISKALLTAEGYLDKWYAFEAECTERP